MKDYTIYFATNRKHIGKRWKPDGYGSEFSADGRENLRFGKAAINGDEVKVEEFLNRTMGRIGKGDGEGLAGYFSDKAKTASIEAFPENLDPGIDDKNQSPQQFGSTRFFDEIKQTMMQANDVVIFIHGYNVSWSEAIGSSLALQEMLNKHRMDSSSQKVMVISFTWPSDGSMFPFRAYKADRADARDSGYAVGRGFLKLRDFLTELRTKHRTSNEPLCDQEIHLLCHSMGSFVLQGALQRVQEHSLEKALPRIFKHIFLCAADVDDSVLENNEPMGRLHELCHSVNVYFNNQDKALLISDTTKHNVERLGAYGAAHPYVLHKKIQQIDCTPVVKGIVEHSYFLSGCVNEDIRFSVENVASDDPRRVNREATLELPNVWRMKSI